MKTQHFHIRALGCFLVGGGLLLATGSVVAQSTSPVTPPQTPTMSQSQTPEMNAPDYNSWDTNSDRNIDSDEFYQGFTTSDMYRTWDTNQDGMIDDAEYNNAAYGFWDADRNQSINESEWSTGTGTLYQQGSDYGTFRDWDLNQDGMVDQSEYQTGLNTYSPMNDTEVTDRNRTYSNRMFQMWNSNQNEYLEQSEFDSMTPYFSSTDN
ncbi:hypothetical protein SAMN05421823_101572 [Catalinimonas alkaloidigena]|uniref:Uncharacterized protein n=1 Tax=Catalinimonas alkaloidigena TaxID=1075417 RepID=A0A1G8Y530_9BACT|nr:hypothetical protein [Catalinimonas alkaloidigena]SDJ97952.1 hypothetical protein SAMN05421823_101572 [Catalinimonas alkaloidigena]